jgi:hypothetical protein
MVWPLIVTLAVAPYLYGSRLTILLVTSILLAVVAFIVTALVKFPSVASFASDVCILSPPQRKINTFIEKISKFSRKHAFRQRKRREKRLWFFGLGG